MANGDAIARPEMNITVAISTIQDGNMYIPDDQENNEIVQNRSDWLEKLEIDIAHTTRLHITYDGDDFCRYRFVDATNRGEGMKSLGVPADALVTTTPGLALFLPVADCVATTLFDEATGVVMLSHLGRHSLEQQGGVKSVEYLVKEFGVNPTHLKVCLGPAPNKEVYPIYKLNNQGMKEATFAQLRAAGVQPENIIDNPADTATDDKYYSHSEFMKGNKPEAGRFAMVAVMKKSA